MSLSPRQRSITSFFSSEQTSSTEKVPSRNFRKFLLLLWKNYMIQRRHKLGMAIDFLVPIMLCLLLVGIRYALLPKEVKKPVIHERVDINVLPPESKSVIGKGPINVVYCPNNSIAKTIVSMVATKFVIRLNDVGFKNEEEMEKYIKKHRDIDFLAGVVFENMEMDGFPTDIQYKIRLKTKMDFDDLFERTMFLPFRADSRNPQKPPEGWVTQQMFPMFPLPGPRSQTDTGPTPYYYNEGFVSLQHALAMSILEIQHNKTTGKSVNTTIPSVYLQLYPYPPYLNDDFVVALQTYLPVIIMMSYLFSSISIVKCIVQEKEAKIKESMKMMGLSAWLHWCAWYIKSFVVLLTTAACMVALLTIRFSKNLAVLPLSNIYLIFTFMTLYVCANIAFCFAVSVFFQRVSSAVTAFGLIYFFSYVPYMYIQPRYLLLSWWVKIMLCLLPNTSMAFGCQFISMFEGTGVGINWKNFQKGATLDDNFSMSMVFIMLIVDMIIYALVTWYVDAVYPGEFGVAQPVYFPCLPSYWMDGKKIPVTDESFSISGQEENFDKFEPEPVNLRKGIQIKHLTKKFGKKKAVDNISLNMYEGQITVLLGHNGAGKTTTMSMLTGLITPTGGSAIVNNYDITINISGVRSSLGLCPQHDVLFPELTVEEHLSFFHSLKGAPSWMKKFEIERIISMLNMGFKRNNIISELSGGMRRKLSVGIALIGGSKVVMLDEPTSGMDPAARRETWDVINLESHGRTILLTTHFMDEADLLGDRVAIMANGRIVCCGSPLFLKKKYGSGYQLVIIRSPKSKIKQLNQVVTQQIPGAVLDRKIGTELTFILPHERSAIFPKLFTYLEKNKGDLGIEGFGISMTTMEEVFLKVGEILITSEMDNTSQVIQQKKVGATRSVVDQLKSLQSESEQILESTTEVKEEPSELEIYTIQHEKRSSMPVWVLQILFALLLKRYYHSRRNYGLLILQLLIPMLVVSVALIINEFSPKVENEQPLILSLKEFPTTVPIFVASSQKNESVENLEAMKLAHIYSDVVLAPSTPIILNNDPKYRDYPDMQTYLLDVAQQELLIYLQKFFVAVSFWQMPSGIIITAFYNDQSFHSAPIAVNMVHTCLFRYLMNDTSYKIQVTNHPLPTTLMSEMYHGELTSLGYDVAFNMVFGIVLVASSFSIFIIKERSTKSKHLQYLSGISFVSYWTTAFIWDFCTILMTYICIALLFYIFQEEVYIEKQMSGRFAITFITYSFCIIPFIYLLSLLFTESANGFTNLAIFNGVTGMATFVASIMLYTPAINLEHVADYIQWVFLPLPNYSLAWAFYNLYKNYVALSTCTKPLAREMCESNIPHPCCKEQNNCGPSGCLDYNPDYFAWDFPGIGRMLIFMASVGILSLLLLALIEMNIPWMVKKWFTRCKNKWKKKIEFDFQLEEEEDVMKERQRVEKTPLQTLFETDIVIMKNLKRKFGKLVAVNNISLGIPQGECFGLLGTTGAGKTTVFRMLTGDCFITSGEAYLQGLSVIKDIKQVQKKIGYCPQFDAVIDLMTGREIITMYARFRGIPEKEIGSMVQTLSKNLAFTEHIDKFVKNYSGGNKRKLSTAVAMIGNPPIVFLDEPTTGVDPVSRRMLWVALAKLRQKGCSIILTTHSMEECEALCTRLAIMVRGKFVCLGSPQHLKNKFGQAYTLIAKLHTTPTVASKRLSLIIKDQANELCHYIHENLSGSELKEIHQGMIHYNICNPNVSLASLFSMMESIKREYNIEDYSISQTTLEEVFLNFTKEGEMNEELLEIKERLSYRLRADEIDSDSHQTGTPFRKNTPIPPYKVIF